MITYLFALLVNAIENRLISRLCESRLLPRLLVVLITGTETLGAEVEGITERLVDACEGLTAGHEDLCIWLVFSSVRRSQIKCPANVDVVESKYGDHVLVQRLLSTPVGA